MQTNLAVQQNKNIKLSESLWRKGFAKEPSLKFTLKDWTSKRRCKWWSWRWWTAMCDRWNWRRLQLITYLVLGSKSLHIRWSVVIIKQVSAIEISESVFRLYPVSPPDNTFALPTEVFSSCLAIVSAVTVGGLFLCMAGPATWNWLPDSLRDPAISRDSFRRSLKTFLFSAYLCT